MSKKYEITEIQHPSHPDLHRIRALRDIPDHGVKKGDLGGWVETEKNLSQHGTAWIADDACLFDAASVNVFALVAEGACVFGDARVSGEAQVFGDAWVHGEALVDGRAKVCGDVVVDGSMQVFGDALVGQDEDILHATVMASERFSATLHKTKDGHNLAVGCWQGTVPEFRAMIESDEWVEAEPEDMGLRRPELLAFASMCEARIATWDPL